MQYEFHEAADIFSLDEEHMEALAADIKTNGQQVPIEIMGGKVLDGRRRLKACEIAGVKPLTRDVCPADPVAYVLSLNLHRRHLTPTQLSMVAARVEDLYAEKAKERQHDGQKSGGRGHTKENLVENLPPSLDAGKARDQAAKAVGGVSGKSVGYAKTVLTKGTPELIKAVDQDKIAVSTAARISQLSTEEQASAIARITNSRKRPRTEKANAPTCGGAGSRNTEDAEEPERDPEQEQRAREKSKAIFCANAAIDDLKKIPKNDPLRKRGFQIVTDWIRRHK